VINGAHVIVYSRDAEADRAFVRDVLGFHSVDAGGGWLIFALPPAELALHPAQTGGSHELYLMCDDVHATVAELAAQGVEIVRDVSDQGFGLLTAIRLPGGGEIGLYEPRHPSPLFPAD
jgi:catechol 2,3-dioxygenase-like lactoylglutathione lyase family enzyme